MSGNVATISYLEKKLVFCFGSHIASQMLLPLGEENLLSASELRQAQEVGIFVCILYAILYLFYKKNKPSLCVNECSALFFWKRTWCSVTWVGLRNHISTVIDNIWLDIGFACVLQYEQIATRMVIEYGFGPDDNPAIYFHGNAVLPYLVLILLMLFVSCKNYWRAYKIYWRVYLEYCVIKGSR